MKMTKKVLRALLVESLRNQKNNSTVSNAEIFSALRSVLPSGDGETEYTDSEIRNLKDMWLEDDGKENLLQYFFGGASTEIGKPGEEIVANNSDLIASEIYEIQGMTSGKNYNVTASPGPTDLTDWAGYGLTGSSETFPSVDVCFWSSDFGSGSNPFNTTEMIAKLILQSNKYNLVIAKEDVLSVSVKFSGGFGAWPNTPGASPTRAENKHNFSQDNINKLGFVIFSNIAATKLRAIYTLYKTYINDRKANNPSGITGPDLKMLKFLKLLAISGFDLKENISDAIMRYWLGLRTDPGQGGKIQNRIKAAVEAGRFKECFGSLTTYVAGFEFIAIQHAASNMGIVEASKFPVMGGIKKTPVGKLTYSVSSETSTLEDLRAGNVISEKKFTATCVVSDNLREFLEDYKTAYQHLQSGKNPSAGAASKAEDDIKGSKGHKVESVILTSILNNVSALAAVPSDLDGDSALLGELTSKYNGIASGYDRAVRLPLIRKIESLDEAFMEFMSHLGIERDDLDLIELSSFDMFKSTTGENTGIDSVLEPIEGITGYDSESPQVQGIVKLIDMIENAANLVAEMEYAVQVVTQEFTNLRPSVKNLAGLTQDIHDRYSKRIYFAPPMGSQQKDDSGGSAFILTSEPTEGEDDAATLRSRAEIARTSSVMIGLPDLTQPDDALRTFISSTPNPNMAASFAALNANRASIQGFIESFLTWLATNQERYGSTITEFLSKLVPGRDTDIEGFKTKIGEIKQALGSDPMMSFMTAFSGATTQKTEVFIKNLPGGHPLKALANQQIKAIKGNFNDIVSNLKILVAIVRMLSLPNPDAGQYATTADMPIGDEDTAVLRFPTKPASGPGATPGEREPLDRMHMARFKNIFQSPDSNLRDPLLKSEDEDEGPETLPGRQRVFNTIKFTKIISGLEQFINAAEAQKRTVDEIIDLEIPTISSSEDNLVKELRGLKSLFEKIDQKIEDSEEIHDQFEALIANVKPGLASVSENNIPEAELLKEVERDILGTTVKKPAVATTLARCFTDLLSLIDIAFLTPNAQFKYFADDSKRKEIRTRLVNIMNTFSGKGVLMEFRSLDQIAGTTALEMISLSTSIVSNILSAYRQLVGLSLYINMSRLAKYVSVINEYYEEVEESILSTEQQKVAAESRLYESIVKDILNYTK